MSEPIPQQRDLSAEDLQLPDTPSGEVLDRPAPKADSLVSPVIAKHLQEIRASHQHQQEVEDRFNAGQEILQQRFGDSVLTSGDTFVCRIKETHDGQFLWHHNGRWNEIKGTYSTESFIKQLESGVVVHEGDHKNGGTVEVLLNKIKTPEGTEYVYGSQGFNAEKSPKLGTEAPVEADETGGASDSEFLAVDSPSPSEPRVAQNKEQKISWYGEFVVTVTQEKPLVIVRNEAVETADSQERSREMFADRPQLSYSQEQLNDGRPISLAQTQPILVAEPWQPRVEDQQLPPGTLTSPQIKDQEPRVETKPFMGETNTFRGSEGVNGKEVSNTKNIFTVTPEIGDRQQEITIGEKNEKEMVLETIERERNPTPERIVDALDQSEIGLVNHAEQALAPAEQINVLSPENQIALVDGKGTDAIIASNEVITEETELREETRIIPGETIKANVESSFSPLEINMAREERVGIPSINREVQPEVTVAVTAAEVAHLPLVEAPVAIDIFDRPSHQSSARTLPDVPLTAFFADIPAATKQFEALRAPDSRPVEIVVVGEVAPDGTVLDATVVKAEAGEITYEFRAAPARQQLFSAAITRQMFEHYEWEADSRSELLFAGQAEAEQKSRGNRQESLTLAPSAAEGYGIAQRGESIRQSLSSEDGANFLGTPEGIARKSLPNNTRPKRIDIVIDVEEPRRSRTPSQREAPSWVEIEGNRQGLGFFPYGNSDDTPAAAESAPEPARLQVGGTLT